MARPTLMTVGEDDKSPVIPSKSVAACDPTVTVEGALVLDGDWILRRYSNDRTFERLRLKRRRSRIEYVPEIEPQAAKTTRITGPRANNVISQPDAQNNAAQPTRRESDQAKSQTSNVAGPSASKGAAPASRQVVYYAAFDEQGNETRKKGVPKTRMLFNLPTELLSPKTTRNKWISRPTLPGTSRLIVTEGWSRAEKDKVGTWHFLTSAVSSKCDEYDESHEGRASQQMGNKGHWESDTLTPTAEDINNFRECMRIHRIPERVSAGIEIVWVEEDEEEEAVDEGADGVHFAPLRSQKQSKASSARTAPRHEPDEPAASKNTRADRKASKFDSMTPQERATHRAGLDNSRSRPLHNRARAEHRTAVETDEKAPRSDQKEVVSPKPAAQPVTSNRNGGPRNAAKRKASIVGRKQDVNRPELGSSRFYEVTGARGRYVQEADGSSAKRARFSGDPFEEQSSSPLSSVTDSEDAEAEGEMEADDSDAEAEGASTHNPHVISSGEEDSD